MDYYKNADKLSSYSCLSYNQVTDVQRAAVVTEPVQLSEMKEYAKVENSLDDGLLTALISSAREICEKYTGVSMVQREITAWFNNGNGGIYLPYGPVGTITGVYDIDGNEVEYEVKGTEWKQILSPIMSLKAVYQGGAATCPEVFKTAIKAQVLFMYENRGDSTEFMSPIAQMILNPFKRI